MKNFLIAFIFSAIVSCKTETRPTMPIEAFSSFVFTDIDTVIKSYSRTFLFLNDSILILHTDSSDQPTCFKTFVSNSLLDTLTSLAKDINFDTLINNHTLATARQDMAIYCGAHYGFIDNKQHADVFIPYGLTSQQKISLKSFTDILYKLTGEKTQDTIKITRILNTILQKHLATAGPPPKIVHAEFIPPDTLEN